MAKSGRPALDGDKALVRHVAVRLSPAEHAGLFDRATAAGLSVSEYIRAAVLIGPRGRRTAPGGADVFSREDRAALLNIGNNLNQIARARHAGREHAMSDELDATRAALDAVLDRYLPK